MNGDERGLHDDGAKCRRRFATLMDNADTVLNLLPDQRRECLKVSSM